MARRRHNLLRTTLGAQLSSGATTVTFAAALQEAGANIATLTGDDIIVLVCEDEVLWLTAYTAGATTGTVARGKEGTAGAVTHPNGTAIESHATALDFADSGPVKALKAAAFI